MQELLIDIDLSGVTKSLFRKKNFDFITMVGDKWNFKQQEALEILTDNETEEFLYGGAAGGAKTWTGCVFLLFMCLLYPNTVWFIGREELKRITKSTLITFHKVAKAYRCTSYRFNAQSNTIIFKNGSVIDLLELKYLPRDPMFERFGSIEYTGGFIEEGGEINFGAFDVLRTRVGRQLNNNYCIECGSYSEIVEYNHDETRHYCRKCKKFVRGIKAQIFISCNPKKNWLYQEFYKPYKNGELKTGVKRFLQAFVQDNPFIDSGYIERLKRTKDKAKKERLLNGNWDYDDNPYALCGYDNISAIFENDHLIKANEFYLTADVARFGSDRARIGVWRGWELVEVISFDVSKTTEIQAAIDALRVKYQIPKHNCIADEDGVGGGVVDNCGIKGFVNNSRPFKEAISDGVDEVPNYDNLQTQCLFGLADKINETQIYISADVSTEEKESIIEELGTIERDSSDLKKLTLTKKAKIKEDIGRSPDWRDMLLMRKYFDYAEGQTNSFKFIR